MEWIELLVGSIMMFISDGVALQVTLPSALVDRFGVNPTKDTTPCS